MKETLTIALTKLQFDAFHGWHDAEAQTGNRFEVDAFLTITAAATVQDIDQTVNYVRVFEIIQAQMLIRRKLLETLLQDIAVEIEASFPQLLMLKLSIRKLTAPITNFTGAVGVHYEKEYL